jgi:hypothetical protein
MRGIVFFVTLLLVVVSQASPVDKSSTDARASCLKACAGAPREADGKRLLSCLTQCDARSDGRVPDGGSR